MYSCSDIVSWCSWTTMDERRPLISNDSGNRDLEKGLPINESSSTSQPDRKEKKVKVLKVGIDDEDEESNEKVISRAQVVKGVIATILFTGGAITTSYYELDPLITVTLAGIAASTSKSLARLGPPVIRFPLLASACAGGFVFDHYVPGFNVGPVMLATLAGTVNRVIKLSILGKNPWK